MVDRGRFAELAPEWDALAAREVLTGLPADGEASRAFESASRQARRPARAFPHIVSPIADLGGGVAGFYQDVSRKALKNVDRRRRRLEREHDVHTRPVFVPSQPGEAVTRFLALEESGWKGRRGTAIALLPEVERFYWDLADAFASRGELRFSELWVDGRPAASEFILVHAGRVFLLKVGMDERRRGLAPGVVLLLAGIEAAAEAGCEAYEFLGNATALKRRLSTGERRHVVLRSYDRAALPLAAYGYCRWVRPRLKAARDRIRPRDPRGIA